MATIPATPNQGIAAAIAILLGYFGFHLIYMRNYPAGAIWFLTSVLLSWTFVVPIILWGVAILQGIGYLFERPSDWARRFEE